MTERRILKPEAERGQNKKLDSSASDEIAAVRRRPKPSIAQPKIDVTPTSVSDEQGASKTMENNAAPGGAAENESVDEDEVGYQKPPRKTRFKKGQSGNPNGRRKGSYSDFVNRVLYEQVTATLGRKKVKIPRIEFCFRQLMNKAAMGDGASLRLVHSFVQTHASAYDKGLDAGVKITEMSDDDLDMIIKKANIKLEDDE